MWGNTFMKSTEQGLTPQKNFLVVAFLLEKDKSISDFSRSYFFVSIFVSYVMFHVAIFVSFYQNASQLVQIILACKKAKDHW